MLCRLLLGTILLMSVATVASARDVAVVSGKSGAVQTLAIQDLVKICSGKMTKWPDGTDIKIFISDPSGPGMKMVMERIFNITSGDARAALKRVPNLKVLNSDQDVIATVPSVPGAIGFVDVYRINGSVVVMKVDGKLPLEPGYVLHKSQ